jgi:hypothetical protein
MNQSKLEWILTHSYKEKMIDYIRSNPLDFDKLIQLIFSDRQPYAWRAAWLLWSCMEDNDPRVRKYVPALISTLPVKPDNMKKDIFTILLKMEIDEEYEGILFDHCVSTWEDLGKKPAVRANALKIMMKIALKYPDLLSEIDTFTRDIYLQNSSTGLKRSVMKRVETLNKSLKNKN